MNFIVFYVLNRNYDYLIWVAMSVCVCVTTFLCLSVLSGVKVHCYTLVISLFFLLLYRMERQLLSLQIELKLISVDEEV